MNNEDSRGLKRLYKGGNSVPKFQDNLTMKKTPHTGEEYWNTGK
jgi:hypothetical protein